MTFNCDKNVHVKLFGEIVMATYVSLLNLTENGVKNFGDSPRRAQDFAASAKKYGVAVKDIYWTLGAFDGVLVYEADSDESAAAAMLALGSLCNVSTQTLPAFDAETFKGIAGKVSG